MSMTKTTLDRPRATVQPLALNVVALAFVLLHAITWFNLAPQAIVVRMGGRRVPPPAVAAITATL